MAKHAGYYARDTQGKHRYVSLQERTRSCFDLEYQGASVVPETAGDSRGICDKLSIIS